jgi:dihydrofolate synthase / folylpolyglutamate synthase
MAPVYTYQQALDYLYQNLPMFQRVGAVAYKKDLTNTLALCEALGNPQNKFKSIHIAGTNGKGSTSHMLASILQEAGYKTGLYTSPHLKDFTERIRLNGEAIGEQFVIDFLNKIQPTIERLQPSFFEITVAMAFDYFVHQKVDVAVVEVGLGGRLDSTNVITPELSVITNIGWDHMDILGDTLEKIALEKAGIIKNKVPVIISQRQPEVEAVFTHKAEGEEAPICFAEDFYEVTLTHADAYAGFVAKWNGDLFFELAEFPLGGVYQKENVQGVLMTAEVLNEQGFVISVDAIQQGLTNVVKNTHLKGRWQKLGEAPLVICDTGHNRDGIARVVKQLSQRQYNFLHIVIGMVKEKDAEAVLKLMPREAAYYFCQASIPRAEDAEVLYAKAKALGLNGRVIRDVNEAIRTAKAAAGINDLIFIGGSTFVVAEIEDL